MFDTTPCVVGTEIVLVNHATKKNVALNENNAAIVSETPMLFQLVRPGHTKAANTVSIMSSEKPDWYLRHANYRVSLTPAANTDLWLKDATFIEHPDTFFDGFTAFQSVNYPEYYISVNDRQELYIRRFEDTTLFHESASFVPGKVLSTHDHLGLREHYIFVMNIYI